MKVRGFLVFTLLLAFACSPSRPAPVNPHATPEARELLSFLYDISGEYTLSGEHNFANNRF